MPPPERIATFDNDGTLWSEKPVPFQVVFAFDRVKALAPQHPEWKTREPFASLLKGDMAGVAASGEKGVLAIMAATHTGMTTDEFSAAVAGLDRDGDASENRAAVHRDGVPADAGSAGLPARQRVQDLHRLGRRRRVHAPVGGTGLRHSAGAGRRQQRQAEARGAGTARRC